MQMTDYAKMPEEYRKRRWDEKTHPYRSEFQRDRDRVIHSKAFRQLEAKTQVFINGQFDRIRTRLTHTIEVAAISRTIARALHVDEDLAETIALAHDLGHTPFGHAGEKVLEVLMQDDGGFEHNLQALRIVDNLEIKYPGFMGLNLTWATRSGLMKHRGKSSKIDGKFLPDFCFLESQIADVADDLTYLAHDIDDGLVIGLLNEKMLEENILWNLAVENARKLGVKQHELAYFPYVIRCFIDMTVADVISQTKKNLEALKPKKVEDVENATKMTVEFSPEFLIAMRDLKNFMYDNLYYNKSVTEIVDRHAQMLKKIFDFHCLNPEKMEKIYFNEIIEVGKKRAVADFICSLNDREVTQIFARIN